jgi:hypothetical protein
MYCAKLKQTFFFSFYFLYSVEELKIKTKQNKTKNNQKQKIFNDGCLGSHTDEERSEVR